MSYAWTFREREHAVYTHQDVWTKIGSKPLLPSRGDLKSFPQSWYLTQSPFLKKNNNNKTSKKSFYVLALKRAKVTWCQLLLWKLAMENTGYQRKCNVVSPQYAPLICPLTKPPHATAEGLPLEKIRMLMIQKANDESSTRLMCQRYFCVPATRAARRHNGWLPLG